MKRFIITFIAISFCLSANSLAQVVNFKGVSIDRMVEIVKAEDELRYDETLEGFMKHPNPFLRKRAALAAGRIGNEKAIPILAKLAMKDTIDVRPMAAFAIGEIESIKGADAILTILNNLKDSESVRAKAIEAAGKIVAAEKNAPRSNNNPPKPESEKSKLLSKAILENLKFEAGRRSSPSEDVILLGVTAALRAKPKDADMTIARFLDYSNWLIRANTLNTLARLRSKNVNKKAKELLIKDKHPVVRANAARVLGSAGDKTALDLIMNAALNDKDLRVRVNAIRALSGLKDIKTAEKLLERSEKLFAKYKKSKYKNPPVENELLTLVSALGNILKGTENARAITFLEAFRNAEKHTAPEAEIALVRISPKVYIRTRFPKDIDWKGLRSYAQALGELVSLKGEGKLGITKKNVERVLRGEINNIIFEKAKPNKDFPSYLNAYAKLKQDDFHIALFKSLKLEDVIIRSTAANLLGDVKPKDAEHSREIYKELSNAFYEARDDKLNDAALAILDALEKQYKQRPPQTVKFPYLSPFISGMKSPDYLIRRKAAKIYRGFNIPKPDPMTVGNPDFKPFEIPKDINVLKFWEEKDKYGAKSRVKRADYRRALSRKNGQMAAVLRTEKGFVRINLYPEDAPLTVDNFINLAESGYFNGLAIHRVVPNFVVQDGDPRGDGSGGPGWQIRCEINQIPYERGMVGMALSGKDTGGSQWFVAHSPQPHLDGGYAVFGRVNETDMKIVDNLARGDKILDVKVVMTGPVR